MSFNINQNINYILNEISTLNSVSTSFVCDLDIFVFLYLSCDVPLAFV